MLALVLTLLLAPPAASRGKDLAIEDPSQRALAHFHEALGQTAKKKHTTRILWFGASHTAADLMTGRIRSRLQRQFGDAGHGFFMPAKPWSSYRHTGLVFDRPTAKRHHWHWDFVRETPRCHDDGYFGLAGMSVLAKSKDAWARIATRDRGKTLTRAGRFELHWLGQRKGGDLLVSFDGAAPVRLRTAGRGLGTFTKTLSDGPHQIELRPKGNGEVRLLGAVLERRTPGVVLDVLGINGSRARSLLQWNDALFSTVVARRKPDLVVMAYGTNESGDVDDPIETYEEELVDALRKLRRAAPDASCLLVGPSDRPIRPLAVQPRPAPKKRNKKAPEKPLEPPVISFKHREREDAVIATQRRVAARFGCGFWDTRAATGGPFSIVSWVDEVPALAAPDFVHFTRRGYRILGDLLVSALLRGTRL